MKTEEDGTVRAVAQYSPSKCRQYEKSTSIVHYWICTCKINSLIISYFLHILERFISGQSYKASTIIAYESRVVNMSNLLVITTVES